MSEKIDGVLQKSEHKLLMLAGLLLISKVLTSVGHHVDSIDTQIDYVFDLNLVAGGNHNICTYR